MSGFIGRGHKGLSPRIMIRTRIYTPGKSPANYPAFLSPAPALGVDTAEGELIRELMKLTPGDAVK